MQSQGLFTQEIVYSNNGSSASGTSVTKSFTLNKPVSGPVYVFYLLTGVYQNHRRFVTSRSYPQLRSGTELSNSEWKGFLYFLISCIYLLYFFVACDYRIKEGQNVEREDYCGIAYASRFNDTLIAISKCDEDGGSCVPFSIDTNDIITSSDKVSYFSRYFVVFNLNSLCQYSYYTMLNESIVSWMKPAAMSTFVKPIGVIKEDLKVGNYTIDIQDCFILFFTFMIISSILAYTLTTQSKSLLLSQTAWFGLKNTGFGIYSTFFLHLSNLISV